MSGWKLEVNDSLQDVVNKVKVLFPDAVHNEQWFEQQLIGRYGEHFQFNEVRGIEGNVSIYC